MIGKVWFYNRSEHKQVSINGIIGRCWAITPDIGGPAREPYGWRIMFLPKALYLPVVIFSLAEARILFDRLEYDFGYDDLDSDDERILKDRCLLMIGDGMAVKHKQPYKYADRKTVTA